MTERPILFSGPMVRAILDGTKTQTRRIIKPQPAADVAPCAVPNTSVSAWRSSLAHSHGSTTVHTSPYGVPGDRLWVRETWAQEDARDLPGGSPSATIYRATATEAEAALVSAWKPSIHMPRWASRITLEVTSVRVERLHDITEEDAQAEGVTCADVGDITAWRAFCDLWKSINGAESWAANPWVWVVGFKRMEEVAR